MKLLDNARGISLQRPTRRARGTVETDPAEVDIPMARRFYCEALRGRQVWRTGASESGPCLWFIVQRQIVSVAIDTRSRHRPIVLEVDDPAAVAARCWNAGYTVYVEEVEAGDEIFILDPFGHTIHLVSRV